MEEDLVFTVKNVPLVSSHYPVSLNSIAPDPEDENTDNLASYVSWKIALPPAHMQLSELSDETRAQQVMQNLVQMCKNIEDVHFLCVQGAPLGDPKNPWIELLQQAFNKNFPQEEWAIFNKPVASKKISGKNKPSLSDKAPPLDSQLVIICRPFPFHEYSLYELPEQCNEHGHCLAISSKISGEEDKLVVVNFDLKPNADWRGFYDGLNNTKQSMLIAGSPATKISRLPKKGDLWACDGGYIWQSHINEKIFESSATCFASLNCTPDEDTKINVSKLTGFNGGYCLEFDNENEARGLHTTLNQSLPNLCLEEDVDYDSDNKQIKVYRLWLTPVEYANHRETIDKFRGKYKQAGLDKLEKLNSGGSTSSVESSCSSSSSSSSVSPFPSPKI